MSFHFSMGARNKITNEYEYPKTDIETFLFRDFLIQFEAIDVLQNEIQMPIINLGNLCNVN